MTDPLPTIPIDLRVHLAHAAVQAVADECGADVLHIKGPALHPSLTGGAPVKVSDDGAAPVTPRRASFDADVLVRPAHVSRLAVGLRERGWLEVNPVLDHGLVQHSTDWYHPQLGQVDLHVRFPGIQVSPADAFERLWHSRTTQEIAHRPCVVPGVEAQRLILLLHAARDLRSRAADVRVAWDEAPASVRESTERLARELRADVALAAATGRLEYHRDRPEYRLWRLYLDGAAATGGFAKLAALAAAAPDGYTHPRHRVARHALRVVTDMPRRLQAQFARTPTRSEVLGAYRQYLRRGLDLVRGRPRP